MPLTCLNQAASDLERSVYLAGACFPLHAPSGWRWHDPAVKLLIEDDFCPQNLQVYCGFSSPSYRACFPRQEPSGCLWQKPAVRLETLAAFDPQYLQ
jgi:hypothetical protein